MPPVLIIDKKSIYTFGQCIDEKVYSKVTNKPADGDAVGVRQ